MQRRRRKAVLRKPTANRAQERPVMKIQMRPVGEKLDSDVSRFPYRFQEINRHRPASMDLRRDSELHEGIVQERNVMIGGYVCPYVAAGSARDRKSTRLNSSHLVISYAVFCLKKKKK